jgi:hypothetical protein
MDTCIYTQILNSQIHIFAYIHIMYALIHYLHTYIHAHIHTVHEILYEAINASIILRVLTPEDTTVASLLGEADGASALLRGTLREGLVFKANSATCRYNFKAISNQFLLKHDG